VATNHQDDAMQQDEDIEQRCKSEALVGKSDDSKAYHCRQYFKKPDKLIFGINAGPNQKRKESNNPQVFDFSAPPAWFRQFA